MSAAAAFGGVHGFAADPSDFDTMYVATRERWDRSVNPSALRPGGVFKTADGGRTWTRIMDYHFASGVVVSPRDSRVVYAATNDHPYHDDSRGAGILKSTDGGRTWTRENTGLSCWQVKCLGLDPHDPSRLLAGTGGNGVFVGTDAAISRRPTASKGRR